MISAFMMSTHGRVANRLTRWKPEHIAAARRNIANFKRYRHLLREDVYHLLPQAHFYLPDGLPPKDWDAIEFVKRDGTEGVAVVFRGIGPQQTFRVHPKGLQAAAEYAVTSYNTGSTERLGGQVLASRGIEVNLPEVETSEILHFRRVG
jgi:hypothetical protein